ncbi:MAG: peptidoglycan DD-metalloendopeptidase family protein [Actinobacteria bacterium]|nr:peptidoglycan DD-metalloendopeptidase family protein [Actinomycetota bacterium]MDA3016860.1 peptidoglycan DD-metalloendopeptidase family protein [Actinomycetota bacterium]
MSTNTKFIISSVAGAILSLGLVVPAANATPTVLPAPGDSGATVVRMQKALVARGFTLKGGANGVFSPTTQATLKSFQKVVGFKATGRLDNRTAKFLGLIAPHQPVAKKVKAPVAKKVKAAAVPAVAVAPAKAPKVAQVPVVIAPTPNVAAVAVAPIDGMLTLDTLPSRGQRSDAVRLVQQKLIANSIEVKGGADGIFGIATTISLTNFQTSRGLNATGAVDLPTAIALGVLPDLATLGITQISAFPSQGRCTFVDSWHESRPGGRLHIGVDIIGPKGLALYAVSDGTITKMYGAESKLSGNALRLTAADGTYFFYAHLDSFASGITVGTPVRAGQIIGYMGSTGNAGNSHLHFEVHPGGGEAVNPYPIIKAVDACHVTEVLPQP